MGMNREQRGEGGETQSSPAPNPKPESEQPIIKAKPTPTPTPTIAGKSCKGCLYYSSIRKSKSKAPTCVGFSKTIDQVPGYIVGETELEASKEGRDLVDFRYLCVGYSVHLDSKNSSAELQKTAKLPVCVGLEVLLDRRPSTTESNVPAYVKKNEDGPVPQIQRSKPSHSMGDEFLNRFKRNAGLVTSGVIRNLNKVGKHIKERVDDILYPYRRPPK